MLAADPHDLLPPDRLRADAARLAQLALAEDGAEDVTSRVAVAEGQPGRGVLEVRTDLVLAGVAYADAVVAACGLPPVRWQVPEGTPCPAGSVAGTLDGPLRALLRAERVVLNLLQRASGVATATRAYADAVAHTRARILHTRKTAPGLRLFDVAAVLAGGGAMHRLDLSRSVMVKDNHWQALRAGGRTLADALGEARRRGVLDLYVEVETEEELREACAAGATRLLIDNQPPATAARWSALAKSLAPAIELEATGGITLENVSIYAGLGVDYISIGALTHSVRAADLAFEITRS